MNTKEQTSSRAINTKIKSVLKSETTLRDGLQDVLVMIAVHAKDFDDCSALGRLCNGLSRSVTQVSKITRFMAANTSIRVGADTGNPGMVKSYLARAEDGKSKIAVTAKMVDAVRANKWYEFEVPPVETIFTIEDATSRVKNVISFLDRLLKGDAKSGKLHPADTAKVQQLRDTVAAAETAFETGNVTKLPTTAKKPAAAGRSAKKAAAA